MIVLSWLLGNPRHFKAFVENWVSTISDLVALVVGVMWIDPTTERIVI